MIMTSTCVVLDVEECLFCGQQKKARVQDSHFMAVLFFLPVNIQEIYDGSNGDRAEYGCTDARESLMQMIILGEKAIDIKG